MKEERFWVELAWHPEDTLESWGRRFLHAVREQLPILSAALYGQVESGVLDFIAGYALRQEPPSRLLWGEGPIGEAARTRRTLWYPLKEAPPMPLGPVSIAPVWHVFLPWVYQGETWAVMEALLWRTVTASEETWLREESPLLAMLASSVFQQQRIQRLLREMQAQNRLLEENLRRLEETQAELNSLNASLEARVAERTQELRRALEELSATQQQLILSEKMAALGQLVAGVAHEINSPLGAIKGSAETLLESLPALWNLLQELVLSAPGPLADTLRWIEAYLQKAERPILTSKEERAMRKRYAQELEQAGLPEEADTLARRLVEAGFYLDDLTPLLPLLRLPQGISFLYHVGQLKLQLENIVLAANRTRKTVFALKSYAHTTDRSRPVLTRLEESVETILTLYQNQLKQGVTVYTDYASDLPPLYLYADEISQVWTNLIQNAFQAMQGKGELFVQVYPTEEAYCVRITDTGPGIPPELLSRIFEPFFTTKAKGEGTGLGLDICRRIVEKHRGHITVESQPGRTSFTVCLPSILAQPDWDSHESSPERI